MGHRQQSTKIGSEDTVAVATAMETAAAGAATTAAARQRLPWALAQMELPSPPPGRVVGDSCDGCVWGCACWLCVCCAPLEDTGFGGLNGGNKKINPPKRFARLKTFSCNRRVEKPQTLFFEKPLVLGRKLIF